MTRPRRKVRSRGRRVEVPENEQREIVRLQGVGQSLAKIAEITGYSRWTVDRVIKENRGDRAVRRKRSPEALKEVVVAQQPVDGTLADVSMKEVVTMILEAAGQARTARDLFAGVADELEALWERAEHIANVEESLTEALSTFRVLRDQLASFRIRLNEAEARNTERAMVVHSEGSKLREG